MSQDRLTEALCSKLPAQVQEAASGSSVANTSSDDPIIHSFLKTYLRKDEYKKYVHDESYDKTFTLNRLKRSSKQKPRKRKTALSLQERKELGLYKPKITAMKYKNFLPLYELWKDYFTTYLDIEGLRSHGFTADPSDKQWDDVTRMLLKGEYQGAILTVQKAACSSMVGTSGIVVMDTKNTFKLLGEDDRLRTIPKQSSVFCFTLEGFTFTILGSQFCMKPTDRSSKKIKTFMNLDL